MPKHLILHKYDLRNPDVIPARITMHDVRPEFVPVYQTTELVEFQAEDGAVTVLKDRDGVRDVQAQEAKG